MLARLRLLSGLVLFIFVLGHFSNHSLGLVSLKLMNDMTAYTIDPWRTTLGTILILASLSVHALLAVWALYSKRSLRMKTWEYFQIISGFAIPLLLTAHVLSTRGANEVFGLNDGYAYQLYVQWEAAPFRGVMTVTALVLVWAHSCIGWHYWLRYKRWYNQILPIAFTLALLIPTLAIAGVISAGFRVLRLSNSEKWVNGLLKGVNSKGDAYGDFIFGNESIVIISVLGIIGVIMLVHLMRWAWKQRKSALKLEYRDVAVGKKIELKVPRGGTILEHLKQNRIPHASVCGGRGRCSTCRIRIEKSNGELPPLSIEEKRILQRIRAGEDVRLACQLPLNSDISITALLRPNIGSKDALTHHKNKSGEEQEIAVLFADIRAFTKLSEAQLPFDTAFLLNRYFAAMGEAIEESGGHLDKFIGDGVMALFGVDESLQVGAKKALNAARLMSERLEVLNNTLVNELQEPLRIGIGIHCGAAIIGNMGYKHASGLTAIGDVVNTASRLESMTKEHGVQLIVSEKTLAKSGEALTGHEMEYVDIRGRVEPMAIYKLSSAQELKRASDIKSTVEA